MQSAISDSARLDAAESLLLLAGWQPQVLRDYIYSFYTDVEGRRQESPTPFIQTTCQICSTRISLTDSTDAKCTSTPAISSLGWADSTYQPTKPAITLTPVDVRFFTSSTPETQHGRANTKCVLALFKISGSGNSETKYFVANASLDTLELASRLSAYADATNLFHAIHHSAIQPTRAIYRLPLEVVTTIFQIEYRARIYDSAAFCVKVGAAAGSARDVAQELWPPSQFLLERNCGDERVHWAVHWEKILRHCFPAQAGTVELEKEPRLRHVGERV